MKKTVVVLMRRPRLPYLDHYRVEVMDDKELRRFLASLDMTNLLLYRTPEVHGDLARRFSVDIQIPKSVIEGLPVFDPDHPPLFEEEVRWIGVAWWLDLYQVSILETLKPPLPV